MIVDDTASISHFFNRPLKLRRWRLLRVSTSDTQVKRIGQPQCPMMQHCQSLHSAKYELEQGLTSTFSSKQYILESVYMFGSSRELSSRSDGMFLREPGPLILLGSKVIGNVLESGPPTSD